MTVCDHKQLVLLKEDPSRLRCRHCHLTLKAEDLEGGCCPECLEARGRRVADFDEIQVASAGTVRYRCEACGAIIEVEK